MWILIFFVTFFSYWLDFFCRTVGSIQFVWRQKAIIYSSLAFEVSGTLSSCLSLSYFLLCLCPLFVSLSWWDKRNKETKDKPGRKDTDNEERIALDAPELVWLSHHSPSNMKQFSFLLPLELTRLSHLIHPNRNKILAASVREPSKFEGLVKHASSWDSG